MNNENSKTLVKSPKYELFTRSLKKCKDQIRHSHNFLIKNKLKHFIKLKNVNASTFSSDSKITNYSGKSQELIQDNATSSIELDYDFIEKAFSKEKNTLIDLNKSEAVNSLINVNNQNEIIVNTQSFSNRFNESAAIFKSTHYSKRNKEDDDMLTGFDYLMKNVETQQLNFKF